MNWRRLAWRNALFNLRRYLGYLASSALAVTVFFMFSCFSLNPAVVHGYMTRTAVHIFSGCEYIVIVFAVLFILFFHSALLRSRGREFGLFRVLGMGAGRMWRTVFSESVWIGGVAIGIGMTLGALFLKLFLMTMGWLLELPGSIPFCVPLMAVWTTLLLFGLLFVVEGAWSAFRAARSTPKSLLLAERTRQTAPRATGIGVLAGLLTLGLAYYLAVGHSLQSVGPYFFPILILVTIGTYCLFSHVSVFLLRWLRRQSLGGTGLLVAGRMAHRLKDHTRTLTVVTLLSAAVMSSMGAMFSVRELLKQNVLLTEPFGVMVIQPAVGTGQVSANTVESILANHGSPATGHVQAQVLFATASWNGGKSSFVVVPQSTLQRTRQALRDESPELRPYLPPLPPVARGHGVVFVPYPLMMSQVFPGKQLRVGGVNGVPIRVDAQQDNTRFFNQTENRALPDLVLEVSDADYAQCLRSGLSLTRVDGFVVPNWQHSLAAVQQLKAKVSQSRFVSVADRDTAYAELRQTFSVMLFAGFFISGLFLLACASALYFRIQQQTESDRRQYQSLSRIGLRSSEMGRILTGELVLLFFAPTFVAIVHSTFAMWDLTQILFTGISRSDAAHAWLIFGIVAALYVILMGIYCLAARVHHLRRIVSKAGR
ncbi:ABC transporter permease [Alicyclobacillus contaminans]|uniref:ABC transporter permease n=1 Tax=Alicyclobacillus contaminans TaxID=392016 RepID=UPI0003F8DA63|nr:ABC transporter permease [Alicyclobacillus contaminans]